MPPPTTFPALLARRQSADPARPLVTFYDDATGERVELSATTYLNWVCKTAGLVQDELDVERGGLVLVDLPTHWLGAVWLGAAWAMGLCVTDDPGLAAEADLVVCGPAGVPAYAAQAGRVPVVALSLRPLGGRFTEPLPDGVTDYGAVVLAQPDAFTPYDPPAPDDAAWRDGRGVLSQDEVLHAADPTGLTPDGRLLTDANPCTRDGLATLVAPVAHGAGTVWVANATDEGWPRKRDAERVTAELRA
ncbi:MAG: TIGR03089 family protein [Nocardioidaceae bacterium]